MSVLGNTCLCCQCFSCSNHALWFLGDVNVSFLCWAVIIIPALVQATERSTPSYLLGLGLMFLTCCWHPGASKRGALERLFPGLPLTFDVLGHKRFSLHHSLLFLQGTAQCFLPHDSSSSVPHHIFFSMLRNAAPVNFQLSVVCLHRGHKMTAIYQGFYTVHWMLQLKFRVTASNSSPE